MLSKVTPHLFIAVIVATVLLLGTQSVAQQSPSQPPVQLKAPPSSPVYDDSQSPVDQDIQLLRKNLRSQEKQIVAANMNLTDSDAQKFWPLYDRFASDLSNIYDSSRQRIHAELSDHDRRPGRRLYPPAGSCGRRCDAAETQVRSGFPQSIIGTASGAILSD